MNVFALEGTLWLVILIVMLVVKGAAFVSALLYPAEAYEAADKLTKTAWAAFTGLGFVAQLLMTSPLGLINLVFLIAALVYLADVRPALREVTSRR